MAFAAAAVMAANTVINVNATEKAINTKLHALFL
jgi:hypothetical protein